MQIEKLKCHGGAHEATELAAIFPAQKVRAAPRRSSAIHFHISDRSGLPDRPPDGQTNGTGRERSAREADSRSSSQVSLLIILIYLLCIHRTSTGGQSALRSFRSSGRQVFFSLAVDAVQQVRHKFCPTVYCCLALLPLVSLPERHCHIHLHFKRDDATTVGKGGCARVAIALKEHRQQTPYSLFALSLSVFPSCTLLPLPCHGHWLAVYFL